MKNIKIQVLGSGCATCKKLCQSVDKIVKKLGLNIDVEYSADIAKIAEIGAMGSPVFAIDNKIVTSGKVPDSGEIKKAILEAINS